MKFFISFFLLMLSAEMTAETYSITSTLIGVDSTDYTIPSESAADAEVQIVKNDGAMDWVTTDFSVMNQNGKMVSYSSTVEYYYFTMPSQSVNVIIVCGDDLKSRQVMMKICKIGAVSHTDECRLSIEQARTAYDALTEEQKGKVVNYDTLVSAEKTYEELGPVYDVARVVIDKILAIGDVSLTDECRSKIVEAREAYEDLTEEQKEYVVKYYAYVTLLNAEETYEQMLADSEIAKVVVAKIEAIGDVEYTEECKSRIDEAREAYEVLTQNQRKFVSNLHVLTTAESVYAELKAAMEAVENAIAKIDAIGVVECTEETRMAIESAKNAVESLSEEQISLVSNLYVLEDAIVKYEELARLASVSVVKADVGVRGVWYGLDGRRLVCVPTCSGLYVCNGKLVVVK